SSDFSSPPALDRAWKRRRSSVFGDKSYSRLAPVERESVWHGAAPVPGSRLLRTSRESVDWYRSKPASSARCDSAGWRKAPGLRGWIPESRLSAQDRRARSALATAGKNGIALACETPCAS